MKKLFFVMLLYFISFGNLSAVEYPVDTAIAKNIIKIITNGKEYAYVYYEKKEGFTDLFVFDGKTIQGPLDEIYYFDFSSDGKTLVYEVTIDGKWCIYRKRKKRSV